MWNSSDCGARRHSGPARLVWSGLTLIVLSSAVIAGLEADEGAAQKASDAPSVAAAPAPPVEAPVAPAAGTPAAAAPKATAAADVAGRPAYQLRCWQYGRLLFDERNLDAPPPSGRYALAMQAGGASSLQLVDMGSATCLIQRRAAEDERRR